MKGRRTSTAVFVTICLLMSLVAGAGQALAAAGSPPTASDVATARTDYIKSLEPANGGKANAHAADLVIGGMKIPADVAATKSFAQGKLHVLVTVPGNALAKVSASRSESLATMTQGEAAPAIAAIRAAQDESIARVMAAGVQLTGIMRFSVLFNGYAAQIAVSDLGKLAEVVGRANVHFSRLAQIDDTTSNAQIGADAVRVDPGVDGTGACVGVVDTGVDYTHPDFGGDGTNHGFPTSKIVAGYDFAGDNGDAITNDDRSLIVPDPDPMDTNEHGTHVSGIVAADGKVTGVAPKAKIVIAKISPGSIGSAYSEEIMAAWEYMADPNNLDGGPEGTHPPVQSVNMSFGSVAGFDDPTDPERIAIENAIASGIVASLSAGNSASHYTSPFNYNFYPDYSTLGSPATTPAAISVASSENSIIAGWGVTEATSDADYVYFTGSTSPDPVVSLGSNNGAGYAYAWCGLGRDPGDGPYPDDFAGVDLVGKIALMSRGTTSFYQKINNAAERGAVGAIIANNQPGTISMNTSGSTLTSVSITQADGAALKLKAAAPVGDGTGRLMFLGHYASTSNPAVNTISSFSSWGATPNLAFKPEVTAPGGNIWSTVPVAQGSYANLSGTSMAAPHVAAAAALIRLVHPEWTVEQVKTALMNTGVLLTDPASTAHLPYSPRLQGAGRINVYNAVHNDVTVTSQLNGQAAVALGSVESWKSDPITFPLVLRNAGASPVTYNVTGTVQWVNAGGAAKASAIPGATFAASPSSVTVGPGEARTVVVSVNATGVRLSYNYFPYVEGFVTFTPAAGGVTLHVPYMGYLGNWNDFDDATWAPTFNPLVDLPYAYNSYSANFYGGDVGETGVTWPEDPTNGWAQMGKTIMGTFDATTIAINPTRATTGPNGGIENNIYVLRNIANLKVEVRDVANNLVKRLDNVDWVWRGDYASYGNDYSWYWSGNAPWQWYGTDTAGHMVPDGQYYLNTVATAEKVVNKPGYDAPQTVSFPVFVDTQVPVTVVTGAAPDGTGHTVLTWTVNDPAPSSGLWGIYLAWSSDNWATLSSTWLAPTVRTAAVPQGAAYALYTIDNAGNVAQASAAAGSIAITSPAGLASVDGLSFEVSGTFSTATTGSFELVVGTGAGEQVTYPFSVRNAVTFGPLEVSAVAFASLTGGGTCETTLQVRAVGVGILPPPSPVVVVAWTVPAFTQVTLALTPGWNLISLPFEATLGDIDGAISGYGFGDSGWKVLTSSSTLEPGCGYWIQCSAAGSRIVVGAPVASPVDLSVAAGWNLIGDPFNTSVSVADITNWDKVAHCYTLEHGTWTAVDLNSGSLEPGLGYWVELTQATTLGVTQP